MKIFSRRNPVGNGAANTLEKRGNACEKESLLESSLARSDKQY